MKRSFQAYSRRLKSLKQSLRDVLLSTPILGDCYRRYWIFPKTCTEYQGVFSSYAKALQAVPPRLRDGYNLAEFYADYYQPNAVSLEEIGRFQAIDYPVLVWLREAFTNSTTVFDLGGNTGYGYYAYQKYLPYPTQLSWKVCDLPEAVKAGRELIRRYESPGLSFTTDLTDAEGADVLMSCGTLQYLEPSLIDILEHLTAKPGHLIIHHVPFYDGKEYFTLQNLLSSYVPYKIQNRTQFLADLAALGYDLIDSWQIDRTCHIPFHPDCFVEAYYGFYLRLANAKPNAHQSTHQSHTHQSHTQSSERHSSGAIAAR
jgi:putative methyltransferase (TIGR04325 family)